MITTSAPGKVVLWGEYAVLVGAPAAVLAVDRYASCRIDTEPRAGRGQWRVDARGLAGQPVETDLQQILDHPAAATRVIHHVLKVLLAEAHAKPLPAEASVILDTQDFQLRGQKLGIGSSAAICTATYLACAQLLQLQPAFHQALQAHNALQGKSGSGIDVAAAWHGGSLRYQDGSAKPLPEFDPAQWQFVWTGKPAQTSTYIERFRRWVDSGDIAELEALVAISRQLFEHVGSQELPHKLGDYVEALRALDQAANLGIYGSGHQRLNQLALEWQVVYKPCGAGGGDVGAAISNDTDRLAAFTDAAVSLGFSKLAITRAEHGVHISG